MRFAANSFEITDSDSENDMNDDWFTFYGKDVVRRWRDEKRPAQPGNSANKRRRKSAGGGGDRGGGAAGSSGSAPAAEAPAAAATSVRKAPKWGAAGASVQSAAIIAQVSVSDVIVAESQALLRRLEDPTSARTVKAAAVFALILKVGGFFP